jgi:phospholipid/cholesterol/gamma-HCH transport system substrate-binding protein
LTIDDWERFIIKIILNNLQSQIVGLQLYRGENKMSKHSSEIKIGVMVFIGIILCAGMIIFFSGSKARGKGYPIVVYFDNAEGVIVGAPVMLSGVKAGKISQIKFISKPKSHVELTLSIYKEIRIQKGASAYIKSLGIMGERYVEIIPGKEDGFLNKKDKIYGENLAGFRDMAENSKKVFEKLDKTIEALNKVLETKTTEDFKASVENIREISKDVKILISENKPVVSKILTKIEDLSDNLNELTGDKKEDIAEIIFNLKEVSENLNSFSYKIDRYPGLLMSSERQAAKFNKKIKREKEKEKIKKKSKKNFGRTGN